MEQKDNTPVIANPKNYDPCMHTAEHILNQTMVRLFGCGRAFNAHIERKKSKCDYKLEKQLSQADIEHIEALVNEIIQKDLPVTAEVYNRDEASKIVSLERLPDDAGEHVRIIRIGDYDVCPCSGIHAQRTSEIGIFKIISWDQEEGILRIRFKLDKQ